MLVKVKRTHWMLSAGDCLCWESLEVEAKRLKSPRKKTFKPYVSSYLDLAWVNDAHVP